MQCSNCGHNNRAGSKFCQECAAPLARSCTNCGNGLPPAAKFCPECGRPARAEAGQLRFISPETYIPKHLAEKILNSKTALEGERKQVTVLFADLTASLELLADRDPEEARKLLDPVLEHMLEAVHRYEGTVNQVMGDGIMALFGAPLAHEDHAVRACYAALRMQESMKRYAEKVRRSHAAVVKIRVGLNSGEVVVRAIGSDLRMDYTAIGQTTHLAARMEQIADPGAIVIASDTLALAEGYVEVKPLGPVPVKGLADAVEVHELIGAGPARTRFEAATRHGLTRFVGRGTEVEQLRRSQQLAGNGRGQVVAIVGEAGVGKSRLVYEFTQSHRLQGWPVLASASVSYGKATSYLPVTDLLKGYFKIQDRDDLRDIREKVTGKLLTLDEDLRPTLPALLALLDASTDDASWGALDPPQRRRRMLDAVRALLLREAREQPVIVIFEDLQWIDGETQAVLDGLVESLGSARLFLLVNYRPEYQHTWSSKTYYSHIRLDALPIESAGEFLDALLGKDRGLAPLKQLLVKHGNPFFLEEIVRTLVETKVLQGDRGGYRLTQLVQAIRVPATVQAMLAARIDRLAPEDKRLLQTAAVVGKDVPLALLQTIAELPDEALRGGLARLQTAEFIYETALFPDLEYSFKHALTHQVTYNGLLQERRRQLHATIVESIEALHPDRLSEQVYRLAHHAFSGEMWDKAQVYFRSAGMKSAGRSAYNDAAESFERALLASAHLPPDRHVIEERIEVRFALRNALWPVGEIRRVLPHLLEAKEAAEAMGDELRIARACSYLTHYYRIVGDSERAIESALRAETIESVRNDLSVQVPMNLHLGLAYHARGEYPKAIEVLGRNVDLLTGDLVSEHFGLAGLPAVYSRTQVAWSLAELGSFRQALEVGRDEVAIADAAGHPLTQINALFGIGYVYLRQGSALESVAALERAFGLCQSAAVPFLQPVVSSLLGYAYALSGRMADAMPLLVSAVESAASMHRSVDQALWTVHLSEAQLWANRVDDASGSVENALRLARQHGERGNEAHALRIQGELATMARRPDAEAEMSYQAALALAEELRMRPLIAHCQPGLGKLYRRIGKRQEAREHLATATTMYREMDMQFWLHRAEADIHTPG